MTFPFAPPFTPVSLAPPLSGGSSKKSGRDDPAAMPANAMMMAGSSAMSGGVKGYEAWMKCSQSANALSMEWCQALMACRNPMEVVQVNTSFMERSLTLWRSMSQEIIDSQDGTPE
ncbi:MAG: hypothetical protein AAFV62_00380 [Pseudomonadota bacterium]